MSVANLGFAIDSSPLAATTSELDRLTSAATKAEQAAAKVSGAGTRMSRGLADLNPALDKIVGSLGRLEGITTSIDKRLDLMAQAAGRASKANQVLDRSAIEASTAYKQLEASLNAVTAAQKKADAAQATSLSQIQKQKDAIAALNAELQKLRAAPPVPGNGRPSPANNNGQAGVGNIAAQLFDTLSTAPYMSAGTVGFQQGPQFAQAFAGQSAKQALAGLGAGFAAIVSPVSLAAIGLTTAAAAAVSFGVSAFSSIGKASDALEKHDEILKRIKDRYDAAAESGAQFGQRTQSAIAFDVNQDRNALQKTLQTGLRTFAYRATPQVDTSQFQYPGADLAGVTEQMRNDQFGPFADTLRKFVDLAREGKGDVLDLNRQIQDIANTDPSNKRLQTIATDILKMTEEATKAATALEELRKKEREVRDTFSRTEAAANAARYGADRDYARLSMTRRFDADVAGIGARSPAERAAAERRRLEAEPIDPKEDPANRALRISQQVELITRRAQQQLADAQRDRSLNLDKILQDQQSEIDLIGKTGGAAVALRKEYELTSQLRLEAARQGIDVDQKELDLIKERAAALGELTDRYNQQRFNFEMGQQAGDARLSQRDRQITTTLRQYGLPEDLRGANAARIGQQLDWSESKDMFKGFFSSFEAAAWENGGKIGDALGKAALNSLQKATEKLWDNIFDQLATGLADALLGARGGSTGGGAGGAIGSVAAAMGGRAANDNFGRAPVGAVTRSALPDIAATTDVASYIAKAASARGIDPSIALRVAKSEGGLNSWNLQSTYFKNGVQEPSYGPFQLYTGGGLGNDFMRKTGLDPRLAANGPAGVDFALDHASKNGWGAWYGAAKVGVGKWDGIGGGGATDAVNKLADAAGAATKGLDTFGGGLGKIGQSLSTSFFPAAPSAPSGGGGGGLFGWLGGLFGGGPDLSKYTKLTGLFADGTNYAPGGMAIVGERGPELVDLPQGSRVYNTNKSAQMMAGAGNDNGGGVAGIRVFVDQDGNWQAKVEQIARGASQQTNSQGFTDYSDMQRRGGFGEQQRRYASQKG